MANRPTKTDSIRRAWDRILGTKSHVRALRVLEQTRESMAVRELARRASEHLRAVQLAVQRLVETGMVERVGTGAQQQVRLNERHPLLPGLHQLFEVERWRFDRLVDQLRSLAKENASQATAIWLREGASPTGIGIEVNLLAPSREVDAVTDALCKAVADLMHREDVVIEVQAWTLPDLEALGAAALSAGDQAIVLQGILPEQLRPWRGPTAPRSHAAADAILLDRAKRVAAVLERRPELIRQARSEVRKRLATAPPSVAKTLREWQELLHGLTIPRLQRWLVGRTERATRLRQSMPLVFLRASDESEGARRGTG